MDAVAVGIFLYAGQSCTAGSRLLLERSIHDAFLDGLIERAEALEVGSPLDDATQLGPMVSRRQLDRVLGYVERGRAEGARLVLGGEQARRRVGGRLLHGADDLRRRRPDDVDRARGDLRAGPVGHPVRHRGRGARARQRQRVRARQRGLDDATSTGRSGWRGGCASATSGSTPTTSGWPRARSVASSRAASAASSGWKASTPTSSRSASASTARRPSTSADVTARRIARCDPAPAPDRRPRSRSTGATFEGVEGEPLAVALLAADRPIAVAQLPVPPTARADVLDRPVRLVRVRGRRRAERPVVPRAGARGPGRARRARLAVGRARPAVGWSGSSRAGSRRRSTTTGSCGRAGCASGISTCSAGSAGGGGCAVGRPARRRPRRGRRGARDRRAGRRRRARRAAGGAGAAERRPRSRSSSESSALVETDAAPGASAPDAARAHPGRGPDRGRGGRLVRRAWSRPSATDVAPRDPGRSGRRRDRLVRARAARPGRGPARASWRRGRSSAWSTRYRASCPGERALLVGTGQELATAGERARRAGAAESIGPDPDRRARRGPRPRPRDRRRRSTSTARRQRLAVDLVVFGDRSPNLDLVLAAGAAVERQRRHARRRSSTTAWSDDGRRRSRSSGSAAGRVRHAPGTRPREARRRASRRDRLLLRGRPRLTRSAPSRRRLRRPGAGQAPDRRPDRPVPGQVLPPVVRAASGRRRTTPSRPADARPPLRPVRLGDLVAPPIEPAMHAGRRRACSTDSSPPTADVVIVGAGIAGLALRARARRRAACATSSSSIAATRAAARPAATSPASGRCS